MKPLNVVDPSVPVSAAPSPAFLSLKDAAEQIGCTRRFLENRIRDSEIAVFRPSKRLVRIKREEFDRWVEAFTSKSGAS